MAKLKGKEIEGKTKSYKLIEHLADGGNGSVWKAECNNKYFAIKFLKEEELKNDKKKKRFCHEIDFLKDTNHENIVHIFDFGKFDGKLFYVMSLYDKTLKDVIQEESTITQCFNYILQICEGIRFIQNKDVIHRDIKPENILLADEKLVIADFGIAHFEKYDITKEGELLGNRAYAAPEQKKKGLSKEICKSADIYALGCIINELFTKENPTGTNFIKIVDKYPWLNKLDNLVDQCMRQNPLERPGIDEVILEINLLKGENEKSMSEIRGFLEDAYEFEEFHLSQQIINEWLKTASEDILIAKYIFENVNGEDLEKYNHNYNCHIHYKIDDALQRRYFNELLEQKCNFKFSYESSSYANGSHYKPLDLNLKSDKKVYNQFLRIMEQYGEVNGRILKLFASCCDYHCEEILRLSIPDIKKRVDVLLDAPILYIVKDLKNIISSDIKIESHILINWEATKNDYSRADIRGLELNLENDDELEILNKFKEKYNIIYRKRDAKYSVLFGDFEKYLEFKEFAINLSKPYYIFEGDVLDIVRIKREHGGIVELNDLDSFGVTNVLAKILGLRTDY
ncbi:serine/threonine protein kinase [Listeria booriae]|uniref:Serine/threonine protein kinase n=1 Tax=Listeria booriae TaxID=1552123 RepID=A0A7X1CD18_9LIST|nr:serine/threonine-protein kinase [Listeria booriae]MBC1492993.1 serine/threonine protein kinase [Listeria booriae]MBC6135136.1 serine/threonine protein kinase [Listeria booriae]